jgi:hypothetical protein
LYENIFRDVIYNKAKFFLSGYFIAVLRPKPGLVQGEFFRVIGQELNVCFDDKVIFIATIGVFVDEIFSINYSFLV